MNLRKNESFWLKISIVLIGEWRYLIICTYYNPLALQYFTSITMQLKHIQISNEPQNNDQNSNDRINYQQYNFQYFEEYKRLYHTAFLLSLQLKQLSKAKDDIDAKLLKIEKKNQDFKDDLKGDKQDRKKRFRRTAQAIQRRFVCEVQRCQKCYGSDGSLQQHIKLKHPQLYSAKSQPKRSFQGSEELSQLS